MKVLWKSVGYFDSYLGGFTDTQNIGNYCLKAYGLGINFFAF